jgi:ribosomal protein RSM22 (predicted rRNA methylase)
VAKTPRQTYPDLPLSAAFYALLRTLGTRHGLGLGDPELLAQGVAELSRLYTREREGLAGSRPAAGASAARLGFFLPRDMIKVFGPLEELRRAARFPARARLRVLDLGAGLGASTLGLSRFLCHAELGGRSIEATAVERDQGSARLMRALCSAVAELADEFAPIHVDVRASDLRNELSERGPFDLVLLGFVLNELFLERPEAERAARRAELLRTLCARLAPDGALIVLEPALKQSTRELMHVRDLLRAESGGPFVFAPCVRQGPCPMLAGERDWCHEALDFALPAPLAAVAQAAGLRYQGLSYAALTLTNQPRAFPETAAQRYRVVSDPLRSKGKLELYGCGDPGYVRLTRLDRDASEHNRPFEALRRGDVAELGDAPRVGRESAVRKV